MSLWVPGNLEAGDKVLKSDWPEAQEAATDSCGLCGEEAMTPVDISVGSTPDYVEAYRVCCHPRTLYFDIDLDGEVQIEGEHE